MLRNPDWRKKDQEGALKINPADAEAYGIANGDWVSCSSATGTVRIKSWLTDEVPQGMLSMPHGYGLKYPGRSNEETGAAVNVLTSLADCDPLAKTPYHKNVRVKISKAVGEPV